VTLGQKQVMNHSQIAINVNEIIELSKKKLQLASLLAEIMQQALSRSVDFGHIIKISEIFLADFW